MDVREALEADQVSLMPCYLPVHRQVPGASAADRLQMLALATAGCTGLNVDDREILRSGPSYTIDTLTTIRASLGDDAVVVLIVGQDAFNGFVQWKSWQAIPELAHLVVVSRPGSSVGQLPAELSKRVTYSPGAIRQAPTGCILMLSLSMLDVSSTEIRQRLITGKSVKCLLPDAVIEFIEKRRLYRGQSTTNHRGGQQ